jgi:hypothetical protein
MSFEGDLYPGRPPRPPRSIATWIVLLVLWAVGLVIWAGYIVLLFLAVVRFFS